MPAYMIALCILLSLATQCAGRLVRAGPAGRSVLLEVEDVLGKDVRQLVDTKASELQETLRHTFLSLPKNGRGAVRKKSVSYALHRLFVQLHGRQMLDRGEPMDAFPDQGVPKRLVHFFHQRIDEHGLDLHELSVIAALAEHFVSLRAEARLSLTFQAEKSARFNLPAAKAFQVMRTYLATYLLGHERDDGTIEHILDAKKQLAKGAYPRWGAALEMLKASADKLVPQGGPFDDKQILAILEEVADHIFEIENQECGVIRDRLIAMERSTGSGRVALGDFYKSSLNRTHTSAFTEAEDYLRQAGALDESDASWKFVMIPNYVLLESNCWGSGANLVCCKNECEELIDHIEMSIMAPTATPSALLDLVATMAPKSVADNGTVTPELRSRLEEVAEAHGGQVALHGRLFAQWMHHVYPRTCPFPHESGLLEPEKFDGQAVEATYADRLHHIQQNAAPKSKPNLGFGMWTDKEELVDSEVHNARASGPGLWTTALMLLGAVAGAAVTLAKVQPVIEPSKLD